MYGSIPDNELRFVEIYGTKMISRTSKFPEKIILSSMNMYENVLEHANGEVLASELNLY